MKSVPHHPQRPRGFTLIELLVVISIIALLATMGVAGGQIVIKKARNLQASAVMKGLEIAIKSYKTEYLRMPSADTATQNQDNDAYDTSSVEGMNLLNVLLATEVTRNPRQIRFWDPPPAKTGGAGYSTDTGLKDPWGKQGYMIVLDYSADGKISNPYAGGSGTEPSELTADVILYCAGANNLFDEGGAGGGGKVDDVKSWQ